MTSSNDCAESGLDVYLARFAKDFLHVQPWSIPAMMRTFLALFVAVALATDTSIASAAVQLEKQASEIVVTVDGTPLGIYSFAEDLHRPYFREIRTADGTLLTRPISPPGGDHPHHTGVWLAVDKVNGIDFWHLAGRIENTSVQILKTDSNPAVLRVNNRWLAPDKTVILREQTMIRIYENRLLGYDIAFTAGENEVTFGDTEEGFFAFRMADTMREEATGQIVNADGIKTAKGCWGNNSNWVDYYGEVDGKLFGAAIFDHPDNFRRARYHVRDYGLFTISPFGEGDYTEGLLPAQPVVLATGAKLKLRYGIYFHSGDTQGGSVADAYRQFVAQPSLDEELGGVREVEYRSSIDGTSQPAMFYAPASDQQVPLLVTLHTWSGDYTQDFHRACESWCQEKGWAYIHPNFRGPNVRPEATGSEMAVQDIVDATRFAIRQANVDPTRIYLVGTSGGGYMSLLMAGRHPELWAGVSSWVPISDLAAWYRQSKSAGTHYWETIAASCGGAPGDSPEVDRQYLIRSPLTYLKNARSVSLDINAGIRDGHEGSVPVSQSLRAFNEIAHAPDRFSDEEIQSIVNAAEVPEQLQEEIIDPSYGERRPLLRRHAGRARVTLFDGGHELIPAAALEWLEEQILVAPPQSGVGNTQLPAKGPFFPVDERVIEDRWQLRRSVVPLVRHKSNPVMERQFDWEGVGPMPQAVLRDPDDGLLKMWYTVWNKYNYDNNLPFSYNVCYAQSADGLSWERPMLQVFDNHGNLENNSVRLGRFKSQNIDIERSPERYRKFGKFLAIHNDLGGLYLTSTDDGVRFDYASSANIMSYHSDTHNNFLYDEVRDRWLMFVRPQAFAGADVRYDPPRNGEPKVGRRRVAVRESKDLKKWSATHTVLVPEEDDPDYFYGMTVFRRGDLFFGLLQRYSSETKQIVMELAWSGDGVAWHRLPAREDAVLLDVGPAGSWDAGMVMTVDRPVSMGDELWFYYGGHDKTHEHTDSISAVGIAATDRDRFFAVEGFAPDSRLLTRPLPATGKLWINAQAAGEVTVSVHAVDDSLLPGWSAEECTPFRGDALDAEIKWGDKSLDQLQGQMIRLRFHLNRAKLFTFDLR
ncbi:MAG: PmoA family protein [Planctomycetales bacterium]|nr:PmoA family protein [Planctomycetales bacterium]